MQVVHPDQEYADFLAAGRFMLQRTVGSGRPVFYPRVAEPGTGEPLEWFEASGRGRVYACTTVRRRGEDPLNVSLIDLAEGPRLMSRVEGLPAEAVRIGLDVVARIVAGAEGSSLLVFTPADASR